MKDKVLLVWLIAFVFLGGLMGLAQAKVSGQCSSCHTMHNSQNGTAMTFDGGGPYRALLRANNCLGCHSDSAPSDVQAVTPLVKHSSDPGYVFGSSRGSSLAGGDFFYLQTNSDAKVHNVDELNNPDDVLSAPPGYVSNTDYGRGSSWPTNQAVSCAGTYGCHGDPAYQDPFASISGAHHQNIDRTGTTQPNGVYDSYRFLLGILGTEDSDYEKTVDKTDHNGYYAVDRSSVNSYTAPDKGSINYLCGQCHGDFHAQVDYDTTIGSPWIRHPTDYDMNNVKTKEYGAYPGAGNGTSLWNGNYGITAAGDYFPDVPVGSNTGAVNSQVLQASGDAIVLCLSCHKAHGSPYDDLLRWDYTACTAGTQNANCGCFACHTSK